MSDNMNYWTFYKNLTYSDFPRLTYANFGRLNVNGISQIIILELEKAAGQVR